MTIQCTNCNESLPATAKFCTKCGTPTSTSYRACGAEMKAGAKHCMQCGASVVRSTLDGVDEGMMINGEWYRGKGEFVRKVSIQDMQSSFESLVGKTGLGKYFGCRWRKEHQNTKWVHLCRRRKWWHQRNLFLPERKQP